MKRSIAIASRERDPIHTAEAYQGWVSDLIQARTGPREGGSEQGGRCRLQRKSDSPVGHENHVVELHVPMNDAQVVHVTDGLDDAQRV